MPAGRGRHRELLSPLQAGGARHGARARCDRRLDLHQPGHRGRPDVTSPLAAARAMLDADRAHDDPAIWITRLPDEAILARARELEDEGPQDRPLWGVPVAVKDNIDVAGIPTPAACPDFAYTPATHAACVQRLVQAGANIVGKTNLDQF